MGFVNAYDRALEALVQRTAHLGRAVEQMLRDALSALASRDLAQGRAVSAHDDWVDDEQVQIENAVLELISLQQPRQQDLRMLTALLRASRDLERIADYACDIAEVAEAVAGLPAGDAAVSARLAELGRMAADMVHDAVAALEQHDADQAQALNDRDDAVDALYATVRADLVAEMAARPALVEPLSQLLLVARYLERVADHAVNVAETTVFQVHGGGTRPFHHAQDRAPEATGDGS
jgi:phosphate transport system protein